MSVEGESQWLHVPNIDMSQMVWDKPSKSSSAASFGTYELPVKFSAETYPLPGVGQLGYRISFRFQGKIHSYVWTKHPAAEWKVMAAEKSALEIFDGTGYPKEVRNSFVAVVYNRILTALENLENYGGYSDGPVLIGTSATFYSHKEVMGGEFTLYNLDMLQDAENEIAELSVDLPAMSAMVACPVDGCGPKDKLRSLWNAIQHINDTHLWTREAIADWIDDLHDRGVINAEFEPWEEQTTMEES